MAFQWVAGIVAASLISPRTWEGDVGRVHVHVWAAVVIGGLIASLPVALVLLRPGATGNRHVIAAGQMLMGALLIHLSGGRIETHFHVFGSLAFLALYRDWRVLITASAVAAIDHLLRGMFWPMSIYGVLTTSTWRWVEHVGWVVFEDVVLIGSCLQGIREMREVADRQAQLEATREGIEATVRERTEALRETTEQLREGEARTRAILEGIEVTVRERTEELRATTEQLREREARLREHTVMLSETNTALQSSEKRYRFLADAMPQIVWTSRPDGYVDYFNERWYDFTGMPRGEGGDQSWEPVLHPDDRQNCKDSWGHSVRTGEPYQIEYRFLDSKTGEYRWHLGRALPRRNESGEIDHWVGTCTDIDDQKRAGEALRDAYDEVELRVRERTAELALANESLKIEIAERSRAERDALKARETAEAATRIKGEFLANMSHEIRTPMNGIIGMTELALGTALDTRQKEYLGMVKSSAEALLTIINDILDFSKIEAGKLDLETVPFRLRELLTDTLAVLAHRARAKSLGLFCRIAPGVPDALMGDPGRIRQVVLNLVGNAIKFTDSGEVVVSAELQADGNGPGSLRFSVADTGIGIPIEKRQAIFEAFEQADGSTTRKYGGTGLGLSICAKLVAMMGGRIWVEGEVGRGSIFLFDAELGLGDENSQHDHCSLDKNSSMLVHDMTTIRPLRILLADDHLINQKVAAGMLERMGHAATVVGDGRQALRAWREGRFDLILMDVQMPEMDGFEAVAAIRALEQQSGGRVPIVALTAHAMTGDRERCLVAGFDEYLSKPIRPDKLREVIESLAKQAAIPSRPIAEATSPAEEDFDLAAALECVGGDMELLAEIMHLFFDDCPRLLAEMDSAISQSDASTLKRLGHTIRGVAGNFAMTAVVDAASRLETMGKAGELGSARAALEELSDAIERARPALGLLAVAGCPTA